MLLSFFGINQAGGDGGDDDGSAAAAAASPGRAGTAVSSSSSSPSPSPTADDGRAALVTALQGLGMTQAGAVAALEGAARHWPGEALETAVCGWIDAARNDPTVTNKPGFVRQALANGWQRPAAGLDLAAVETAVLALLTRHRGIDHILDAADVPDVVRALALHEGVRQAARQDARFFGNAIKAAVADVNGREREIIEEWRANTERRRRYDALREALQFDMADALAMRYAGAATADAQDQILTHYEQQRQQAKTAVLAGD